MSDLVKELCAAAEQAIALARKHGADDAEAVVRDGAELTAKVRLGEPELVQEADSRALGLRVFKDGRAAVTHTSDLRAHALDAFVAETVTLAELSEPDEFNRLPETELFAREIPDLDLYDESCLALDATEALARARRGERAALEYDERVTNSEGATWTRVVGAVAFANSAGFVNGYRGSSSSLSVEPVCDDEGGKKRRSYWWTAGRFLDSLEEPEAVGREAARRTIATLGPKKLATCEVPVVFEPEVGRALIGMIFSVANGSSMYRKATYMLDREGTRVASDLVTVTDQPRVPRASGSRPFDGDGLATRENVIIRDGMLETVLCDVYSARKLGRQSTGSAGRGVGGSPSPTTSNLIMTPGEVKKEALLADTGRGLYVTSMMGFGFNPVTGDFSRGASGFWIEGGELTYPVSEITVSLNFDTLLQRIDMVASDIDRRSSVQCPTFRVSSMTVAGH